MVSDKLVTEPVIQLTRCTLITKVLQRSPFKAQKQSTARRIGAVNLEVLLGFGEDIRTNKEYECGCECENEKKIANQMASDYEYALKQLEIKTSGKPDL